MKQINCFLIAATIFATAMFSAHAQGWEEYPQGAFIPYDLGVHPNGTVAYAAGREPVPGQSFWPSRIRRGDAGGTAWQDVSLPVGCDYADRITVAPDGTVYLAGSEGRGGLAAGRVWSSMDGGINWTTIAQFPIAGQGPRDIQADTSGNIFITISKIVATSKSSTRHLVTYKGTQDAGAPGGINWSVVDDYLATAREIFPQTLTLRPLNPAQPAEIWIAGQTTDGRTHSPVVRRSLDGGSTWATVSTWTAPSGYSFDSGTWRVVAAADVNGVAYAAANYVKKVGRNSESHWLTFRSTNGGTSWTLADDILAPSSDRSGAAADVPGGMFIVIGGITRVSLNGGVTWLNAAITGGTHVAADLLGNIFVGGSTTEGVIYKLPAP